MIGPNDRPPSSPCPEPRHAALIRIGAYLYRVKIWTEHEWEALPEEQRPGGAAPILGLGWHVTEPVELPLRQAPGDLLAEAECGHWPPLRRAARLIAH
ncbi:MAG TPA: hypothetical protein VF590_09925 [Isosphaeraceae bacterium]